MASFFQVSLSGPSPDRANYTHFEILWNASLKGHQLTIHWYQYLVIALGGTAFVIGCLNLLTQYILKKRRSNGDILPWHLPKFTCCSNPPANRDEHDPETPREKASLSGVPYCSPKLANIKTFCLSEQDTPTRDFQFDFDLHVLALTGRTATESSPQTSWYPRPLDNETTRENVVTPYGRSRQTSLQNGPAVPSTSPVGSIDRGVTAPSAKHDSLVPSQQDDQEHDRGRAPTVTYGALNSISSLSKKGMSERAVHINNLRLRQGLNGIVVSYSTHDSADDINILLRALRHQHVSVILMGDPDVSVVDSINFGLIDGVIIKNASILPDGRRRDFFRASQVRECIARGKRQLDSRPGFFIGFIELWNVRPSPATLRRAFKLADFFGAVVQAQATSQHSSHIEMCLSGFDWLKRPEIIQLQRAWSQQPSCHLPVSADQGAACLDVGKLSGVIGPAENLLSPASLPPELVAAKKETGESIPSPHYTTTAPKRGSIWDEASCGTALCQLGCYNLRDQIVQEHYDRILRMQRDLKRLRMLHIYADIEILTMSKSLRTILPHSAYPHLLQSLLDELASGHVQIFKGLDSGFSLPDDGGHIMGVSDSYREEGEGKLDIYISLRNCHDASTIWHVFLAHHGVQRLDRFQEELLFQPRSQGCGGQLPKSIAAELESSTEAELLLLIEQTRLTDMVHPFHDAIVQTCTALLIDGSKREVWKTLHSKACLDGSLTIRTLLQTRLEYFTRLGHTELPKIDNLVDFFTLLERKLEDSLFNCDRSSLSQLSAPLIDVYNSVNESTSIEPGLDLYALMFFCALRKLAFEDVYLETTDRCPLFLQQHDQAGVFAELWVLGSQCEIYFGILPRALGEIIYDSYHEYLTQHPPPPESWDGKDVLTAYINTQARIKLEDHQPMTSSGSSTEIPGQSPGHKVDEPNATKRLIKTTSQFGAMSIFCFPAIIDVVLLSFLGRGFYVTAFMDDDIVTVADYAILTALIMTGGVTGWVGSTGGFYLFSFAFDNMAHFLVQRFSAAFVLTVIVAFCGFFAFGCQISWFSGLIFVLYLFVLTTFLNLLGIFATMHRLGCPLTSGRSAMWRCIPVLFISPLLTSFVNGHDLLIYMLFLYSFVILLLITFRNLCHEWTTWLKKVPTTKEKDLLLWYHAKVKKETNKAPDSEPSLVAAHARLALCQEVHKFNRRSLFSQLFQTGRDVDTFVRDMATGLPYGLWLLEKESGGAELPEIFTATWFVQLELANANQRQLMRGLKEHSPFITYRYSKYDLGQNVGLFLGVLMDRWIDIAMSARRPEIVVYFDDRGRYGICFGLLYFLLGAVAVDVILQKYWPYATKLPDEKMTGLQDFKRILKNEARLRNKRYLAALNELLTLLSIFFGMMTILLWIFVIDHRSITLYFTYISGYTGALVFQFNRCFTRDPRAHVIVVLVCCFVGFVVGCVLRAVPSTASFFYDFAIGLNVATVSAAIGTFLLTDYFRNPFKRLDSSQDPDQFTNSLETERPALVTESGLVSWNNLFNGSHSKDTMCNLTHKTHRNILQNLCLDIDVNSQWLRIPEDVRRLVLCRVLGVDGQITTDAHVWLTAQSKDIGRFDECLSQCLDKFRETVSNIKDSDTVFQVAGSCGAPDLTSALRRPTETASVLQQVTNTFCQTIYDTVKWTALISGAAPDTSRELWFALRSNHLRPGILWILLKVWKLCWWVKNLWTYFFLVVGRDSLSAIINFKDHGSRRVLQGNIIVVDTPLWRVTGFISRSQDGNLTVAMFDGIHEELPQSKKLRGIAIYDSSHRLTRLEDVPAGNSQQRVKTFYYDEKNWRRWPTLGVIKDLGREVISTYDKHGRVVSGRLFRGEVEFSFEYLYRKRPKGNTEILKAIYTKEPATDSPLIVSVFWSLPPRTGSDKVKNWIPSDKVQRAVVVVSQKSYETTWHYKHARDPDMETVMTDDGGQVNSGVAAPPSILKDEFDFLRKPTDLSFDQADLLVYHPLRWLKNFPRDGYVTKSQSPWPEWLLSAIPIRYSPLKKKVIHRRLPTAVLRTALWNRWSKAPYLDAVSACFMDEMILRKEPLLKRYWQLRDAGYLREAAAFLDENLDWIVSAIEPSTESSQTCPLIIKTTDLFTMGLGKDANQVTARPEDAYRDTNALTSVIFSDNGCWPDNPGGVSNCRRDLVNGHTSIRGHCLAESANDFGLPRYQIERNINSLKILPLWGLDGKTPYHGVLDNLLQTQVDERFVKTRVDEDIKGIFIPLLRSFVKGARMRRYNRSDLVTFSNDVLRMNRYFEHCDFNKTWESEHVWDAWIEAWLTDHNDPNITNVRESFKIEQPSMQDFREALNLYICYFFIYSVELPTECPSVFQSTHHGISSLYGMLLKYRRGTTWGIWDHAILWRETCLNISPAQCLLSIPVQSMLLAGIKLACHLAYTHVDIILPCTSVFNPDWEIDLGTDQGLRGSKKSFSRKIDPIVNGIGNMDAFQPVKETRSKLPTTVMLSNVQFIKDVKNAVLAADVIVNRYGFDSYRLVVYGAQDRQPSYALETTTLINNRGLDGKVILAGFGSPKEVLKDAWLFMNSSLSEGLPLAIGEAALSGIPIVATEVGATALVLTDPDDPSKRYGEVVPPNDPEALARAQLSILSMLGPWAGYTKDKMEPPPLPDTFTSDDVEWITRRMYEKTDDRRALGLKLRDVVLRSFHGTRYLREHEQMYWIQRGWSETRRSSHKLSRHPPANFIFGESNIYEYDDGTDTGQDAKQRWQDFEVDKLRSKHHVDPRKFSIGAYERTMAV